jgi:adenylate cyclase
MGDSALKESQPFIDLTNKHEEFLTRFRAADWDAAETLSHTCETMDSGRLSRLYALYRERITAYRATPPGPDWDGTAEATSK